VGEHRSKNPLRFRQEVREALEHIEATPTLAGTYTSRSGKKYWKVPLRRSREVIYYEYSPDEQLIVVVTISSPVRGGPDL
jgi:hypothetical protein